MADIGYIGRPNKQIRRATLDIKQSPLGSVRSKAFQLLRLAYCFTSTQSVEKGGVMHNIQASEDTSNEHFDFDTSNLLCLLIKNSCSCCHRLISLIKYLLNGSLCLQQLFFQFTNFIHCWNEENLLLVSYFLYQISIIILLNFALRSLLSLDCFRLTNLWDL